MLELCSPPPVSGSPLPPNRFRVRSRVLGQDGRQADFRVKGPLVAPSEKETGCSRSQLAPGLSGRHLLRAALNAPLPGGGPLPAPSTAPGRPSSVLSAHRKPGDAGLAANTSSPYRLPWAKQQEGNTSASLGHLPPLRRQGQETSRQDFPAGPAGKTAPSDAGAEGSIPGHCNELRK